MLLDEDRREEDVRELLEELMELEEEVRELLEEVMEEVMVELEELEAEESELTDDIMDEELDMLEVLDERDVTADDESEEDVRELLVEDLDELKEEVRELLEEESCGHGQTLQPSTGSSMGRHWAYPVVACAKQLYPKVLHVEHTDGVHIVEHVDGAEETLLED